MASCRHWTWTRVVLFLGCLWLLIPACSIGSSNHTQTRTPTPSIAPSATPSATVTPTAQPEVGGSLVVALPQEPDTLNFSLTKLPAALWVISVLDARLIRVASDGSYQAALLAVVPTTADGGISADGRVYTLHFRPDLKWSDGEPLDGRDFRFTWQTIINRNYPAVSRAGWDAISSVDLSSDFLTVTVHLRQSSADFVEETLAGASNQSSGFLLPEHTLKDVPVEEIPTNDFGAGKHVGSGPFKIVRWDKGDSLVVERNSHFAGTQARLDRINFRFVTDSREAISYLTTGEVDLAVDLPETSLPDLAQTPSASPLVTPKAGAVEMLAFNLNDPDDLSKPNPYFSDPRVRQAIALAFNRADVVKTLLLGQTTVAATPLDNTRWSQSSVDSYPFDPKQAAALLDQAGWIAQSDGIRARGGTRLSFTMTTVLGDDPVAVLRRQIQEDFIRDMRAVGIEVRAHNVTESDLTAPNGVLARRAFDVVDLNNDSRGGLNALAAQFGSAGIPTPSNPDGANVMGYRNQTVDRLLTEQGSQLAPATRQRDVTRILQQIHGDVPVIPVYNHVEIDVSRRYVQALDPGPISGLWWNAEEWWVNRKTASP